MVAVALAPADLEDSAAEEAGRAADLAEDRAAALVDPAAAAAVVVQPVDGAVAAARRLV